MSKREKILKSIISELEEAEKVIPEIEKDDHFGEKVKVKPYRLSLHEAKHCVKMYYADNENYLANQVSYELEHIVHLKEYINQLDEANGLKDALLKAITGYEGALRILEFYKIKEEIASDGEK